MSRYLLVFDVKSADGTETWGVEAKSKSDALRLHEEGKSEFVEQEVEVTGLHSDPDIILDN